MASIEPLLDPKNARLTVLPIQYQSLWDLYKKQEASFWIADEIDFSDDRTDFETLNSDEQHFIKMILAFFAARDGIVNTNLRECFSLEIQVNEAQICYAFQQTMENVHSEVYSLMLDEIVDNVDEKQQLFNAVENVPCIKEIKDWAFKYINGRGANNAGSHSFAKRVVVFCLFEGVIFSGPFAAIYWLKNMRSSGKIFMAGLTGSNETIARDEGMHTEFGCALYQLIVNKLSRSEIIEIVTEGVTVAKRFMRDAIPVRLIGMNADDMSTYIEFITDRLLVALGYDKLFNAKNPFLFMETIGMDQKGNFFEKRITQYKRAHSATNKPMTQLTLTDDF